MAPAMQASSFCSFVAIINAAMAPKRHVTTVTKDENPGSTKITLAIYRSKGSQIKLLSLLLFFLSPVFL
jgi:hypothetical protein